MVKIIVVKNPFDKSKREIIDVKHVESNCLYDYALQHCSDMENPVISMNGKSYTADEAKKTSVNKGDCIAVCEKLLSGGGKKNPLAAIASVALTLYTGGIGANFAAAGSWGGITSRFLIGVVQAGIMMIGGAIINSLFPAPKVDRGNFSDTANKQTYGWQPIQSVQGQGGALVRTYGTVRTAGTFIGHHVTTDGSNQYLNLLYCGGEGLMAGIGAVQLNGNPVENYNNVTADARLGENVQTPVPFFDYVSDDKEVSSELAANGPWATQRTDGNAGEALEFTLSFPQGLFYYNESGNKEATSVKIECQYKKVGETDWKPFTDTPTTQKEMFYDYLTGLYYELDDPRVQKMLSTFEIFYVEVDGKNNKLEKRSVSIYTPDAPITINGMFEGAYYVTKRISNIPRGQYDVRLRCVYKAGTSSRFANGVYFVGLSHLIFKQFTRPRKVLLAVRALATNQLSGGMPTVTWLQTAAPLWVWDTAQGKYIQVPSNNPAWVVYDMLHDCKFLQNQNTLQYDHHVFGCEKELLDFNTFNAWAQRCVDLNLTFNYQFAESVDMWSAIQKAESVGRGKVIMRGTKFSCVFDAPKTPSQLFSVGNMMKDSFTLAYVGAKERANCVEVSFNNKDKNYEKDVAIAYGKDWNDNPQNPVQITLDGCDNYAQAYRAARYQILCNEHFIKSFAFNADIDSITCQIGDAVFVQSNNFNYTSGGRFRVFDSNTVTLDAPTLIKANADYAFLIRYSNGVLLTKPIKKYSVATETSVIDLETPFTDLPLIGDVYSFGEINKIKKQMTVLNIARTSDLQAKITCVEFDPAVYDEIDVVPVPEVIETSADISAVIIVENGINQDYGRISILNARWDIVNPKKLFCKTEVQIKKDDDSFVPLEIVSTNRTTIVPVVPGSKYCLRVRLLSILGVPLNTWKESDIITITGTGIPSGVKIEGVYMLDIPRLPSDVSADDSHVYVSGSSDPFYQFYVFSKTGNSYNLLGDVSKATTVGKAETVLQSGVYSYFDDVNTVTINNVTGFNLSNKTKREVINGANMAVLGDELIQFTTVEKIDDDSYKLSGLLRGRLGTEDKINTHQVGERFIALTEQTLSNISVGGWNVNKDYSCSPSKLAPTSEAALSLTFNATGVMAIPYSVCHVKSRRDENGLNITWLRRTRKGGEWKDGADVALGEDYERYNIEVWKGGVIKRNVIVETAAYTYPQNQQINDFGDLTTPIKLRIYQLSAAVGRGKAKEVII